MTSTTAIDKVNHCQWKIKCSQLHNQGGFLHNYWMKESVHDGNHDGVVWIYVCLLWVLNVWLIFCRKFFTYQECNAQTLLRTSLKLEMVTYDCSAYKESSHIFSWCCLDKDIHAHTLFFPICVCSAALNYWGSLIAAVIACKRIHQLHIMFFSRLCQLWFRHWWLQKRQWEIW